LNYFQFPVSFGTVFIFWDKQGLLTRIELLPGACPHAQSLLVPLILAEAVQSLKNYFYTGLPVGSVPWNLLNVEGLSEFQMQVYALACQIPHGETRTYGWIARSLGKPSASRAVGQALKKNPFPILIPCHRVVSAYGVGGFQGDTDESLRLPQIKQKLIVLEEEYLNPVFSFFPSVMRSSNVRNSQSFSI
jgi:methylated-DNA-[protein]-cysteine S-methyltransferase